MNSPDIRGLMFKTLIGIAVICVLLPCAGFCDDIDTILPYLIQVESGGNPNAVSKAGAVGICQITPIVLKEYNREKKLWYERARFYSTDREYTMKDMFSKAVNKQVATWYLRRLTNKYKCDTIEKMLGAYNWGIGNVRKVNYDVNRFPKSVKNYIKKIKGLYEKNM